MDESRVELSVGESIRLDDQVLTVIDIHEDEIIFRIDQVADYDLSATLLSHNETVRAPR